MTMIRVVEDDRTTADLLRALLEHDGYTVAVTSSNFHILLTRALWAGVDVALIDLHLGEQTSGLDVCAYLRDHHPRIRRVVLSAVADNDSLRTELGSYADDVLTKPSQFLEIKRVIGGTG